MLILKQNTAASVPVPAAGKGTIFLSDSDVLSVKNSSNVVESFPTVGGSNTQVIFNDDAALTGSANYTFDKDTNILTVTGNVAATRVLTDNLLYANGVAWDLQQPAGSNTEVIFNDDGEFGASSAFVFDNDTAVLTISGNIAGTNVLTDNLLYANGVAWDLQEPAGSTTELQFNNNGQFGADSALTFTTGTGVLTATKITTTGDAVIGGNLNVNGNLTYVNVDSFAVEDPIISLGGGPNGAALVSNDGKDRGTELQYYSGSAKTAFMGWDNANAEFGFGSVVGITDEVVTFTTYGNIRADQFIGNGASLSDIVGANVTGEVTFAATANAVAGANVSGTVNFAAVANAVAGANVSGTVANATYAVTAGTIETAAQPNITSTGTLTSLNVAGNITAGNVAGTGGVFTYVSGDGANLTDIAGANVSGTVALATLATLATDATSANAVAGANVSGEVTFAATANAVAGGNVSGQVSDSATADSATTAGTVTTAAQPNITSVGLLSGVLVGADADAGDFPNATALISAPSSQTGGSAGRIGLAAEATGNSTNASQMAIALVGVGQANGGARGTGVIGAGSVVASADTGAATGVRGIANDTHAGGFNIGLLGNATGSSIDNYALYLQSGDIGTIENSHNWDLVDNAADALTFSSTGKANVFLIETTNNAEGIATTGYLNVTGNITATAGVITDNLYYANGNPWDLQQPAGSNTQVIFNDAGDFGADATFTFDKATDVLSAPTVTATTLNGTLGTAAQTAITSVGTLSGLTVTAPIAGSVTGSAGSATGTAATVTTAAQPNITSTGTLTALTVTGNVGAGNVNGTGGVFTYVSGDGANLTAVPGQQITGEVDFAQVANSVAGANVSGTVALATLATDATSANAVAGANVSGEVTFAATANAVAGANVSGEVDFADVANSVAGANVSGEVTFAATANAVAGANVSGTVALATSAGVVSTAAQPAITSVGTLTGLTVSSTIAGSVDGSSATAGTVTTAAQPNITSVGTLSGLTVTDTIVGSISGSALSATTATTAGTVTTAAQPNITSVGTLASVTTTGNVDTTGNVVTNNIVGKTAGVTITSIGTNQPVTLVPTGTAGVSVSSKRILDLAEPTASTDAATKQYVDDLAQGLAIQAPCIAGTPGTLTSITGGTITYDNGTAGVGATLTTSSGTFNTLDGISISTDDRVLVKNEATTANNGIYVKTSATILTRADDFNTPVEMAGGDFVFIQQGTTLNDTGFVMTDPVTTIGTDPATFVQFSGAGSFLAGAGLTLTGSTFSITDTAVTDQAYGNGTHNATFTVNSRGQLTNASNVQITAAAGVLTGSVLNSSVTDSSLTSLGTIDTGVWQGSAIQPTYVATLNQNTTGTAGTVTTAAQPNITSVGTLTGLTVSSTISGSVSGSAATATSATTAGTVTTAAQPTITSVGTLSGLTVTGTIVGSVNGSAGSVAGQNVSGEVDFAQVANSVAGANVSGAVSFATTANAVAGANVSGTVSSATSATSATTAGSTTSSATFNNSGSGVASGTAFNGGTARTISYNTIGAPSTTGSGASGTWGISVSGSAASATTAGTVTTAAQPNITSVGTLSSLAVTGTSSAGTLQSTTLSAGSAATAGSIIGDWTLTSGSTLNATYADLAEKYTADADYEPGTVVMFGGDAEVQAIGSEANYAVAGIITTNPAQVYNAECVAPEGQFVVELALIGRVPCKVIGPVHKGDLIVSADAPGFGKAADPDTVKPGRIIGKAITSYDPQGEMTPDGVCEVLVGKN